MRDPATIDFGSEQLAGMELHSLLDELRSRSPVLGTRFLGQPAYLVTTHEAVAEAFRDAEQFPAAEAYKRTFKPVVGRNFQNMDDGEEQRRYRRLATPAFRAKAVATRDRQTMVELAHELIDGIAGAGQTDLAAEFTHRFPFIVICRLLGVPRDAEADFHRWAIEILGFPRDPDRAQAAAAEFTRYLAPVVEQRRREPGNDIISDLVRAEVEGQRMSDEDIFSHIRLLFAAGATTTHDALGSLLYALLTDRQSWRRVQESNADRALAIEELLRWEAPVAILPRYSAQRPTELCGVAIDPGSFVLFAVTAANRDPAVFSDPHRFDLDRRTDAMLTFGPGPRSCPGMHLARQEMATALDVIIERLPGLELSDEEAARPTGAIQRGPAALPVRF